MMRFCFSVPANQNQLEPTRVENWMKTLSFLLQVARSVGVAEQLGAAKAEAEFEATQLRSQVEKQKICW